MTIDFANITERQTNKEGFQIKTNFTHILDIWSFIVLIVLVSLSPLHWLPNIRPEFLQNIRHFLFGMYVLSRGGYHLVTRQIQIPISGSTLTPAVLAFLFALSFRSFTPIGEIVNYIFSIGFGFVVLANVADERYDTWRLHILITTFVGIITIEAAYALFTGVLPIPAFTLPADIRRPYTSPASALSFAAGPSDYTTSVGIALTLTLGFILRGVSSLKWRISTITASVFLLAALVFAIVASGGHGRASFVPIFLLLLVVSMRRMSNGYWFPILIILPPIGIFGLIFCIRAFGVSNLILWLNDFMSNRLLIYDGSIQLLFSHPFGIGFGAFPELYSTPSWYPGRAFNHPVVGPHNFFFNVSIAAGSFTGIVLLYWIVHLSKYTAPILFCKKADIRFPLAAVMIGVLFTGLSIGRMSPFQMYDLLIWWVAFAGTLALGDD